MTTLLPSILERIVSSRRERYGLPSSGAKGPALEESPSSSALAEGRTSFRSALVARRGRAVIAEVKMGSPRLGPLAARIDPERQAAIYAEAGAAALSVVVEPDYFGGSFDLLRRCVAAAGLPAIAKDFVVHPRQLDEAREAGASAILLVAALYDAEELAGWAAAARSRWLEPLVELHGESDLAKLARGTWELVGVNSRDLRTFEVDLSRALSLAPRLPSGALRVAESGIAERAQVEQLAAAGFDAFLVGESLLLAADPAAKLRELFA